MFLRIKLDGEKQMKKKILITGSSGTVGTRLFERLLKKGYNVTGIDRRENCWVYEANQRTVIGDLLDKHDVGRLSGDYDMIIHFAANARVFDLVKNPSLAFENMQTTFNVLEFARKNNIKKIIFSSSREAYGNISVNKPIKESQVKLKNCESPYSASKLTGEALLHAYSKVYGIDFVILRFSNVYGMYDNTDRVIPLWIRQTGSLNEDLIVFGAKKILDFTYIDDAIDGVIRAIVKFNKVKNETFNIASGEGVSLTDVAKKIKKLMKGKNRVIIKDNRPGEVWKYAADISKARDRLGFLPKVGIDRGLKKTIKWYMYKQ